MICPLIAKQIVHYFHIIVLRINFIFIVYAPPHNHFFIAILLTEFGIYFVINLVETDSYIISIVFDFFSIEDATSFHRWPFLITDVPNTLFVRSNLIMRFFICSCNASVDKDDAKFTDDECDRFQFPCSSQPCAQFIAQVK